MIKIYFLLFLLISVVVMQEVLRRNFNFLQHDYHMEFGRMELHRYNKSLVNHFSLVTSKYNRTCPIVNITFSYKIDLGVAEDPQVIIQAYKFASNEYRLFPLRFQVGFCDAINKNMIGVGNFRKCGNFIGCNVKKGQAYHVCNWTPDQKKFPPNIPNGEYMLELQEMRHSVEIWVIHAYGTVSRPTPIPRK